MQARHDGDEVLAGRMVLTRKGIFAYNQDQVHYLCVDDDLSIRIERINKDVARVFLVNADSVQQPIPAHITMNESGGAVIRPRRNNFLVAWTASYTLVVNGQPYRVLKHEKH